jgi:DNA (cytosine-5)-methyltransferase 1
MHRTLVAINRALKIIAGAQRQRGIVPRRKEKMKFISLFAGIGGFDLGLERAGMQCVGLVEINPFCQRVLAHHWPQVKRIGDIRNVNGTEFGAVDLICGGVPCQPASNAGKRMGTQDDRWLWPEAFRVVRSIKPRWCVFENVRGIITLEQGLVFESLLSELEDIGYEVEAFVIPACAVDAQHRRDRVWIVANSKRGGCGAQGERRSLDGISEQPQNYAMPIKESNSNVPDSNRSGFGEGRWPESIQKEQYPAERISKGSRANWEPEPGLGRVANGVPGRVDRLWSLGNAVVPQVVEVIGRAILRAHIVCAECAPENTSEARLTATNSRVTQGAKAHIAEAATS